MILLSESVLLAKDIADRVINVRDFLCILNVLYQLTVFSEAIAISVGVCHRLILELYAIHMKLAVELLFVYIQILSLLLELVLNF
jgi:hypothetical protein